MEGMFTLVLSFEKSSSDRSSFRGRDATCSLTALQYALYALLTIFSGMPRAFDVSLMMPT